MSIIWHKSRTNYKVENETWKLFSSWKMKWNKIPDTAHTRVNNSIDVIPSNCQKAPRKYILWKNYVRRQECMKNVIVPIRVKEKDISLKTNLSLKISLARRYSREFIENLFCIYRNPRSEFHRLLRRNSFVTISKLNCLSVFILS